MISTDSTKPTPNASSSTSPQPAITIYSAPTVIPGKIPIQPLKSNKTSSQNGIITETIGSEPRKREGKKKRVTNHNVIEKKYRKKITDSLTELKILLLGEEHKVSRNGLIAIDFL